jgi:hypothetical protein
VAAAGLLAAAVEVGGGGQTAHAAPAAPDKPLTDGDFVRTGAAFITYSETGTFVGMTGTGQPDAAFTGDAGTIAATGVTGKSAGTGAGVAGYSYGYGVVGQSFGTSLPNGIGVVGISDVLDLAAIGNGRLFLSAHGAGAPTSGFWGQGTIFVDVSGRLWVNTANGTPGTWTSLGRVLNGYAGGALNLLPVPIRLLDTRAGVTDANFHPGLPVAYHGTINVPAAGVMFNGQAIPTGAVAVFGLLTAALAPGVNCGDGSSAIAYAAGATRPAAVSVLYNPQDLKGAYTGNFAVVSCGASGDISLYSQPINPVAIDYIFDCFGFVM